MPTRPYALKMRSLWYFDDPGLLVLLPSRMLFLLMIILSRSWIGRFVRSHKAQRDYGLSLSFAVLIIFLAISSPSQAVAETTDIQRLNAAEPVGEPTAPGPFAGVQSSLLSFYKTMTYTATVLTTDQIWYMGMADKAEATSGIFGMVNIVTSPMLTYAFEYTWERCCEAPPGPDGVRPVDTKKAVIYRIISMSRTFTLALLFGNELGASVLITSAISATRTVAYVANDLIWNRLTASGPPAPLMVAEH